MAGAHYRILEILNLREGFLATNYPTLREIDDAMLIMISGPYRGGTNDDPELIHQNMARLEAMALPIYEKGYVPIIGEWIALPIMKLAGSRQVGDEVYTRYSYPVAHRLLKSCSGVLRIPGKSTGADQDVAVARQIGTPVYFSVDEIPINNE